MFFSPPILGAKHASHPGSVIVFSAAFFHLLCFLFYRLLAVDFLDVALNQGHVIPVPRAPKSICYFQEGEFNGYAQHVFYIPFFCF